MLKRLLFLCLMLPLLSMSGCHKHENPADKPTRRTMLLYLAMNSNLSSYGRMNVDMLVSGASKASMGGGRVLIYSNISSYTSPVLIELKLNKKGKGKLDTLIKYPIQDAASPAVLRQVLDDVKRVAPSSTSQYALAIGSHGSGWMDENSTSPAVYGLLKSGKTQERTIGSLSVTAEIPLSRYVAHSQTGGRMSLDGFASAINDGELEYILFDVCYMGEIETVYALRNKTKWIVAAPSEIPPAGMPYDQILSDLMSPVAKLSDACQKFYTKYQNVSCAIALYDCSKLDALANAAGVILRQYRSEIGSMSVTGIQAFDTSFGAGRYFFKYDMGDFISKLVPENDPRRTSFEGALTAAIPYKKCTPFMYFYMPDNSPLPVSTYSGMASFIPSAAVGSTAMLQSYTSTAWWQAAYN